MLGEVTIYTHLFMHYSSIRLTWLGVGIIVEFAILSTFSVYLLYSIMGSGDMKKEYHFMVLCYDCYSMVCMA